MSKDTDSNINNDSTTSRKEEERQESKVTNNSHNINNTNQSTNNNSQPQSQQVQSQPRATYPQQSQYYSNQYSYTPQQGQQYPVKPKGSSAGRVLKILFSIFGSVFLCMLPLFAFIVFSAVVSSSLETSNVRIEESKIYNAGDRNSGESTKLAVINLSGVISYQVPGSSVSYGPTSENIINQIDRARDDDNVKAILLRFNTPGGAVSAAEPICDAIKLTLDEKPVYSFIDTVGASLGYLLPNCGLDIYSRQSALTGSIGVVIQALDFVGVLEEIGGDVIFITNSGGTQKTGQDIFVEGSPTYNTYQSILDESFEYFLDIVLEGRKRVNSGLTESELRSYANGRVFSGLQAREANLVDEVMEFEETINSIIDRERDLNGTSVDVVEYTIPPSPFSQILGNANNALESLDPEKQLNKGEIRVMMQMGLYSQTERGDAK